MNSTASLVALHLAAILGLVAVGVDGREVCVPRAPETAGKAVGFEVIDLMRREAWVTTDWTVDAYAEFSPGVGALNWLKNDPREGFAARMAFLRSPGCAADGEFTYRGMFGRTFVHVADLTSLGGDDLTNGALTEARVSKHHRLEFDGGQTVSTLVTPNGDRFVRVNRPIDAGQGEQDLPKGWVLQEVTLTAPWTADLIGDVAVLQLDNGVSYQGPVGEMPLGAAQVPIETSALWEN